jgi:hypothetical protein
MMPFLMSIRENDLQKMLWPIDGVFRTYPFGIRQSVTKLSTDENSPKRVSRTVADGNAVWRFGAI